MSEKKKITRKKEDEKIRVGLPPADLTEAFSAGYQQCAKDIIEKLDPLCHGSHLRRSCVDGFPNVHDWLKVAAEDGPKPAEPKTDVVSEGDANAQIEGADAHDPEPE